MEAELFRGMRVALVGPSRSIAGSGAGTAIEAFDLVVRMNHQWPVPVDLAADIGRRMDVLFHCCNGDYPVARFAIEAFGDTRIAFHEAGPEAPPLPSAPAPEGPARFTSDAVRTLFRDVAKTIHPDLALDEHTRHRRHALMIEANKAYARGDEEQLRWILQAWQRSPEAVQGSDPEAMRLRFVRRIAQLEEQLEGLSTELAALKDSPLWELKVMVDQAAIRGKDIVRDMVRRLERDIMAATNRLDAMRG